MKKSDKQLEATKRWKAADHIRKWRTENPNYSTEWYLKNAERLREYMGCYAKMQ